MPNEAGKARAGDEGKPRTAPSEEKMAEGEIMTPQTRKPRPAGNRLRAQIHQNALSVSPVHALLERLERVKQTRADRWVARCPAHDDRAPSLAITETPEGTVLVKCFAGCSAADVVSSVGLELHDLFPPQFDGQAHRTSRPPRFSPAEVVRTVVTEATILELAYRAMQRGEALNLADQGRVELAILAIDDCRGVMR